MGVPRQLTQIAFASPLDESTEDEILDPSIGFPVLQNVRQDRRGGLSKRLGANALGLVRTDDTTRSAGRKAFAHNGRPCVYDGDVIDDYLSDQTRSVVRGKVPEAHFRITDLPSVSFDARAADSVICNGFLVVLEMRQLGTSATGWTYYTVVIDQATGAVVRDLEILGGPTAESGVALAAFGTTVVFGFFDPSALRLNVFKLDVTSITTIAAGWSLLATIFVGIGSLGQLAMSSASDRFYVAIDDVSAVKVRALNASGVIQSKDFVTAGAPNVDTVCLSEDGDALWVGWSDATSTTVTVAALSLSNIATVLGTPQTVYAASVDKLFITATGTLTAAIATAETPASPILPTMSVAALRISAGAVTAGDVIGISNANMCARPFTRSGRTYGWFTSGTGDSCVLAEWTPPLTSAAALFLRPVTAPLDRGLVDTPASRRNVHARTCTADTNTMTFALSVKRTGLTSGVIGVALDFADGDTARTTSHHGVTVLGAGVTSFFDGVRVVELGFLQASLAPETNASFVGDVTLTKGGRKYVAIYASTDAVGNVHLSGVSPVSVITGNVANKTIVVSIAGLALTSRTNVDVLLYATADGGEPPYYFVGSSANSPNTFVNVEDDLPEADLTTRAKLYAPNLPGTAGEAQDRRAPAGLRNVVSYAGMLVGTVGATVVYSGQEVYGEGTWFTPIFEVPTSSGPITAVAAIDGTLYLFTESGIWSLSGEPPSDNGLGGGLGSPRQLASDVGCISASSVVVTSLGVFFQSRRGIELLSRAGSAQWIGEKVQRTLAAYPNVTSAVIDVRNNVVRFSLAETITNGLVVAYSAGDPDNAESPTYPSGGGRDVVFDLVMNDWQSVDNKGADFHHASQDACVVEHDGAERYAWLGADGRLHVETDLWTDDGSWIAMVAETGWFKIAGIQGKQQFNRLLALMRKRSDAGVSISVGYNYDETYATARTWTSIEIEALLTAGWPITQLRHDPTDDAEGQSVRIRVEDSPPITDGGYGTGHGATWLALTLDVTPESGLAEVPEAAA